MAKVKTSRVMTTKMPTTIKPVKGAKKKVQNTSEPNAFTGILIVYDHGEHTDIFDIPAVVFDGERGQKYIKRLKAANGTWINTENSNASSVWLYNQISPKEFIYDDTGVQSDKDGPWFKYKLDMEKFNIVHGSHQIYVAGFAP